MWRKKKSLPAGVQASCREEHAVDLRAAPAMEQLTIVGPAAMERHWLLCCQLALIAVVKSAETKIQVLHLLAAFAVGLFPVRADAPSAVCHKKKKPKGADDVVVRCG
ncbi:hypothetical protein GUJ93_ZPchr0004g40344 [Zizania palustris]|uniref:Uncharacterized protein n=1 Tax=Zizania palustris TaxID=103762 RepID=A0A8J5SJ05_ZIZPA|nr:hypothetical protein GUJ93_ZPchr0004g40344 [Zizania palustris]